MEARGMNHSASLEEVVRLLDLQPHPEGGYFKELFRHQPADGGRGVMTSIYYMPPVGQPSRWRAIDADEVWSFHAGAPLTLSVSIDGKAVEQHRLGTDFAAGETAQALVPKDAWARAESHGGWTLVGGTVAPAFEYEGFRMAPPDWMPGDVLP
jgi:predicted cupin superfamily sugar epimerase